MNGPLPSEPSVDTAAKTDRNTPPPTHARSGVNRRSPYEFIRPAEHMAGQIAAAIHHFWQQSLPVRCFSIAEDPHYYWHTLDYYVVQKGLDNHGHLWGQLRLSEGLCQTLLENSLGPLLSTPAGAAIASSTVAGEPFSLATIRHFEVFLLERFSRRLFEFLEPALLQPCQDQDTDPTVVEEPLMHIVWMLGTEGDQEACIVLTAPQRCFQAFPPYELTTYGVLPDEVFYDSQGDVRLKMGRSWATIEELQHLEVDDVIIFEDSRLDTVSLWDPVQAEWLVVPALLSNADGLRLTDLEAAQGDALMSELTASAPRNIWDNLNVEVTATFEPIRLPLKHLKEMEKGLVLELADLMNNKLNVQVEGHTVAWGELVVVGDRFGIRIQGLQEVIEGQLPKPAQAAAALSTEAPAGQDYNIGDTAVNMDPMFNTGTDDEQGDFNQDNYDDNTYDDAPFDDFDNDEDWS